MLLLYPIKRLDSGSLGKPILLTDKSEIVPWLSSQYDTIVDEKHPDVQYLTIMCRQNKDVYFYRNPYASEINNEIRYIFDQSVEDVTERFYRSVEDI